MTNQQGAPEAPKVRTADYEAGWKDGYKQGAWAAQQPAPSVAPEIRAACSEIINVLAEIVNAPQTDAQFDADVVPRDPLMGRVQRIKAQVDAIHKACQIPQPTPKADSVLEDAAFEAVRKKLCALPRYSFVLDDDGLVRRVQDRAGNWIEFDDAHELFDPIAVDAARAAQEGKSHDN